MLEYGLYGGMAERFKAPVLKTGVGKPTVGSNPTPSARSKFLFLGRCQSGRLGPPAKWLLEQNPTEGSNPSFPAKIKQRLKVLASVFLSFYGNLLGIIRQVSVKRQGCIQKILKNVRDA